MQIQKYGFVLILTLTINLSAIAKTKSSNCNSLVTCLKKAATLVNQKYIYTSDFKSKGKVGFTQENFLNKGNANYFISVLLHQHDFARVMLNEKNSFRIIPARDIRYEAVPVKENITDIPKTYDFYSYSAQIEHITAEEVSRNFRPFMSRFGRIMEIKKSNMVIISDTGLNIHRLNELVKQIDKPLSKEVKKRIEEEDEQDFEIRKLKAKNCKSEID
ncbi:hypothetical protein N9N67_02685 [Bacteriovoracaceae bacterium]|nr:hypothetical protein [Bacteriovoracaceae bacterium]